MMSLPTCEVPAREMPLRGSLPPVAPRGPERGGGGGGENAGGPGPESGNPGQVAVTGMWIALAPILMFFMALVSAYVVRRGLARDWVRVEVPRLLWANTLAIVLASGALERGRRRERAGGSGAGWLAAALGLGLLFVTGQIAVWRELEGRGAGLAATPYSSFFYLLTGAHGVHLAGGLVGLAAAMSWPAGGAGGRLPRAVALRLAAIYWHFMAVLWVALFLLLLVRR